MLMNRIRRSRAIGLATILALAMLGLDAAAQSPGESRTGLPPNAAVPTESSPLLEVGGEVAHPFSLTAAEFAKLPRQTLRAKGHDGVESQYQGVSLIELLAKAGVPTGKDLRGKALALFVVVEASDGYRAVFALAELDSGFTDRVILLADRRDDKPLSGQAGPLQVIVPGEKKHARWVRQAIRIKVGRA
jgi:DMSO/TMAO reductase YedYZ molybdopterin-dependent catalytic subunit